MALTQYKLVDLDSGETCENKLLPNAEFTPKTVYTKRDIEALLMTLRDLESAQRILRVFYASRNSDMYTLCMSERSFKRDSSSYTHVVSSGIIVVRHSQTLYFMTRDPQNACIADKIEEKELAHIKEKLPDLNRGVILLTKLDVDIGLPENIILHDTKSISTEKTPINFVVTFSTKERPGEIRKCVLSIKLGGIFIRESDISFDYVAERGVVVAKFILDSAAIAAPRSHMIIDTVEYCSGDHIFQPFPCSASVEYMQLPPDMEESMRLFLQQKIDLTVIGDLCRAQKMTGNRATTMYRMTDANRVYVNTNIAHAMADVKAVAEIKYFNMIDLDALLGPQDEDPDEVEIAHGHVADDADDADEADADDAVPGVHPILWGDEAFVAQHRGISFNADTEFIGTHTLINADHQRFLYEWERVMSARTSSSPYRPVAFRYKFCYA